MKKRTVASIGLGITLMAGLHISCHRKMAQQGPQPVENGIAQQLAQYRKNVISNIQYQLHFTLPPGKEQPISAWETISFVWKENKEPVQIDFKELPDHIQRIAVNEKEIPLVWEKEHVLIAPQYLRTGPNNVTIHFTAGNLSLNRNEDYLYTLFVPDRARTVFPCFDQPDLKAVFSLSLTLPENWTALSNAPLKDSTVHENQKTLFYFPSDTISTYLFSFVAGKFEVLQKEFNAHTMHFYHRETDSAKIRLSIEPVFQMHNDALLFMQNYTQIPYPFRKFDFVAIPDFQYGGMEHAGAIQYRASTLFLDEGATQDQQIARANLITHETAHMWFGNLVTMQWFNDVWMKEVFANFMADKITQTILPNSSFDLKFLTDHFPAAYSVDRTKGANPIRQSLTNLQDAGTLYGDIIYHKAPIMMRQLESLIGEKTFQQGLRTYLKNYAYSNATWTDLIALLDALTPTDLQKWNKVWVNEPGRPQFTYRLTSRDNRIKKLVIAQKAEDGSKRLWPQVFDVALVYPDSTEKVSVTMQGRQTVVKEITGKALPLFIVFNASGQGYGLFPIDTTMLLQVDKIKDAVTRASVYINLYENMLNGAHISPQQLLELYSRLVFTENEELNLRLLTGQITDIFWQFILPQQRIQWASVLENTCWKALQKETIASKKKLLFKAFQSVSLSQHATDTLYNIWKEQRPPDGIKLSEEDYTALALSLAVRDYPATNILQQQWERINNPDRKKRLAFIMPALSPNVQVRDEFFASLKEEKTREKEAWVQSALAYLHHPLRAATSQKYLPESLQLLEEIQRTGDIFFPQAWLSETIGSYQSTEAAMVVRRFLQQHLHYPPKLRDKILQAADPLFRAAHLLYGLKENK